MIRRIFTFMILLVPILVYSGTTGKISGVVTDQATGDPMIGVNIIVEGTVLGAATSSDGYYTILNVPVGTFTIRASYIGYAEVVLQNIRVSVDLTTKLDITMETSAIAGAEVVVVAERPLIRRDATNTNIIRSGDEIDALPTRGLQAIASQIAGVVREERSTELNIRGGRGEESAIYIDGVFVNDPYNYVVRLNLPNEAIEEMSVQTGGFNAEYGEAMSGILIITTNSGSDRYSGSFEAISDGFLSDTKKTFGAYGYGYNEYIFTLGGPIIPRSKHTFFFSASQRKRDDRTPSWGWAENENKPGMLRDEDGVRQNYEYAYLDPVKLQAGERDTLWSKTFDFTSAQIPGNTGEDLNYSAKIKLQLTNTMELKSSIIGTIRDDLLGDPLSVYRPEMVTRRKSDTKAINVTFTHAPSPKMFYDLKFNYYDTFREDAVAAFGDNIYDYGDPTKNPINKYFDEALDSAQAAQIIHPYGEAHANRINEPDYFAPGGHYGFGGDAYIKNNTTYWGIDFDLTYQLGNYHTFKTGVEYKYHTMREYFNRSPEKLTSTSDQTPIEFWRATDVRFYGYDVEGKEVDDGNYLTDVVRDDLNKITGGFEKQAPYYPIISSVYLQDKIEFEDLILNLGVRYDRIDPNAWQFKDMEAEWDEDGNYIEGSGGAWAGDGIKDEIFSEADTKESDAHTYISPRLGVSFPVTDRTIFHAQYGVFYQPPRLGDLYLSPFFLDRMAAAGGYFTALDNPNLEPPKTTSYEVGFKQRLGAYAALQLTAYYKETEGLTQVLNIWTDLVGTAFRLNGDFGTIKGLDVILTLSRFKNLYATFNYGFQRATGTGSAENSNYDIAWQSTPITGNYPKYTMPLDFEQRHTGALNLDYRLNNTSLNMLFTFTSGNPYTRMQIFNSQPHNGRYDNDGLSEIPISAVNANMAPWTKRLDLRVDHTIPLGGASVSVYLWVLNALNTRNVKDVWITTGLPDDTGYLSTSSGKAFLADPQTTELEKANLQMREMDYNNYGIPRQIRLGVKVAF